MEKLISNFSLSENFWDCNPNMKKVGVFKDLYNNDKSTKKKDSSHSMWAVAIFVDKHQDNPYRNLNSDDKVKIIKEDYLADSSFDFDKLAVYVEEYKKYCLSQIERTLVELNKKLEERDIFLRSLNYTLDTASQIDSLILNTKKLKDLYFEMKKELETENQEEGQTRGGFKESATEKGLI